MAPGRVMPMIIVTIIMNILRRVRIVWLGVGVDVAYFGCVSKMIRVVKCSASSVSSCDSDIYGVLVE